MLQAKSSPVFLVPSLGIKHKRFGITEPEATSKPAVTHQPFTLCKLQLQKCLPSLAKSPAVSEVLGHTLQECSGLFALHCALLPADITTLFRCPCRTLYLLSTGTWQEGRSQGKYTRRAGWEPQNPLDSQLQPVTAQDALAAPLLMDFWPEMHFLPHAEVPQLCKKQGLVGHSPKALQCGGSGALMTEK